jgi:uncharacterized protein (DUF1330 family)
MSAYIVVEGIVRDKEALGRYASQAIPLIKEFGGEVLAFGPWELLFGEGAYQNGMIIRFADKDTAFVALHVNVDKMPELRRETFTA